MDFGDQRAGGVNHQEAARLGRFANRRGNAVRRKNHARAGGHLVQFVDEQRADAAQFLHHVTIVDDLFAHIDRSAVQPQGDLHHVDGPHHTGAKAPRT